jgi:hypothetical protein
MTLRLARCKYKIRIGCPAPCRFCKGRVCGSGRLSHAHQQNVSIVDADQACLAVLVMAKAAPRPLFRLLDQSALDRIEMHVAQLLNALVLGIDIEIVEARLPDRHGFRAFRRIVPSAPGNHSLRERLFHALHCSRRIAQLRLCHEQVKMFRHHYVSEHGKPMLLPHLLENLQKQITM